MRELLRRRGDDEGEDIILEMMGKTTGRRRMRRNLYNPYALV